MTSYNVNDNEWQEYMNFMQQLVIGGVSHSPLNPIFNFWENLIPSALKLQEKLMLCSRKDFETLVWDLTAPEMIVVYVSSPPLSDLSDL